MKRYIIIGTFLGMGGGQIYTRNKAVFLKKNGWEVFLYTGRSGKLYFNDLKGVSLVHISELAINPLLLPKNVVESVIDSIVGSGGWEETIIETSKDIWAVWGELIASKCSGKHVFFCLDEQFPKYDDWYISFFEFKLRRREMVGISPKSIRLMNTESPNPLWKRTDNLRFICYNYIDENKESFRYNFEEYDINFGCISRLDKPYIGKIIDELKSFCKRHADLKIAFYLVGDSLKKQTMPVLQKKANDVENFKMIFLGSLSPIPRRFLDNIDFFIGTAGSAMLTAMEGKITINVDTVNGSPLGIRLYNCMSGTFADEDKVYPKLSDYLDYVVFKADRDDIKKTIISNAVSKKDEFDFMKVFHNHMDYIMKSEIRKSYFNFNHVKLSKIDLFKKVLYNFLGVNMTTRAFNYIKIFTAK